MRTQVVVGVIMLVIGGVWFTQGIGVLGGSFMSGDSTWTIIGGLVAAAGIVLLLTAVARRRRAKYESN